MQEIEYHSLCNSMSKYLAITLGISGNCEELEIEKRDPIAYALMQEFKTISWNLTLKTNAFKAETNADEKALLQQELTRIRSSKNEMRRSLQGYLNSKYR